MELNPNRRKEEIRKHINLGKRSVVINASITNKIQEIEERIQVQKIPWKTLTQVLKKMQNAKKNS